MTDGLAEEWPTRVEQTLTSGLMIRQNFKESVRFALFSTGVSGWEHASHGGTVFLLNFNGRIFGITCAHVFGDFNWRQLAITEKKFGQKIAALKSAFFLSAPQGEAIDSTLLDVAVVEFTEDVSASFFVDPPYIVDPRTVGSGAEGDLLVVNGNLKEKTDLSGDALAPAFTLLQLRDRGAPSSDITLRLAAADWGSSEIQDLAGLSGSPVFNRTKNVLCGMVVRAGLTKPGCKVWYLDFSDLMKVLEAIFQGRTETAYKKTILYQR
jgi:hypothetical protein